MPVLFVLVDVVIGLAVIIAATLALFSLWNDQSWPNDRGEP